MFAVAVAAALALPGGAAAQEPPTGDSVTTVGWTDAGPEVGPPDPGPLWRGIEIDVSSEPSGEDPTGRFSALNAEVLRGVSGSATCLAVAGDTATFNIVSYFGLVTVQVVDAAPDTIDIAITQPHVCQAPCRHSATDVGSGGSASSTRMSPTTG